MEPPRDKIDDLMERYGYEEKEALAAYHLNRAEDLFNELFGNPDAPGMSSIVTWPLFGTAFFGLRRLLGSRVLRRDYPEGWGSRRSSEGESPE